MGWRYIFIEKSNRINYRLNCIGVVQYDEINWICLDEIDTIIIEDSRCNTSIRLLTEIAKAGVSLIVCTENHMPSGFFTSLVNNSRSAKYIRIQSCWTQEQKQIIWQRIIIQKIHMQIETLIINKKLDRIEEMMSYMKDVMLGDETNREGHAAKVYFHELFGMDFCRERNSENCNIYNSSLNFIYQIVRSKIAQEIVAHGYSPCFGIFHCSEYNYFALADDIIEVFRPICDNYVVKLIQSEKPDYMDSIYKEKLLNFFFSLVHLNNDISVRDSISIVVNNILNELSFQSGKVVFPEYIL